MELIENRNYTLWLFCVSLGKKHSSQFFFGQIWAKKVKASVLTENWYTWYLGSADSKSGLRFFKFRPQNPFLGKCGPKMSKLTIFPENWHTWHLDDADSYSNTSFWISNPKSIFGQICAKKSQSCLVWLKTGTRSVSTMLFSKPKSFFGQIWA